MLGYDDILALDDSLYSAKEALAATGVTEIANGIWLNSDVGFTLHDAYAATVQRYFDAQSTPLSFSDAKSVGEINRWISDATHGMIPETLKELYPDAACSLDYGKDYELLFSVRLAAQCTDARVNLVTPALFARYPTLESFAAADVDEVGRYVQSCGFWRAKARDIVASAQQLLARFGGKVPDNMDDLLTLPGVGRKTANLILGDIYGQEGYVCDTHCIRITGRLGLTDGSKDPLKVEQQLRKVIPPEEANNFCHRMVLHGRALCMARKPDCENCALRALCDYGSTAER